MMSSSNKNNFIPLLPNLMFFLAQLPLLECPVEFVLFRQGLAM
jgi:hypothetical protein